MENETELERTKRLYSEKSDREIKRKMEQKEREYQHLILDVDLLKFHYKYRWIPLIVSVIGLGLSVIVDN